MPNKFKNYGLIEGQRDTDYVAGANSPIPFQTRNPSGNWEPVVPPGEWQANNFTDSMACVTFSALNCIETQEKFLTGQQVNYSDRWIAKMSGTTKQGNYLYKVADAIRQYGLVLESDYPAPQNYTWDEYYADIPEPLLTQLKEKGQGWLNKWNVAYEWVGLDDAERQLQHAPLQVTLPGHAIEDIKTVTVTVRYFDSYEPYLKDAPRNNFSNSALKLIITPKDMTRAKLVRNGNEYGIYLAAGTPQGLIDLMENAGLVVPKLADGTIDWQKMDTLTFANLVKK